MGVTRCPSRLMSVTRASMSIPCSFNLLCMRHWERGCQAARTANRMMTAISMSIVHQIFLGYPLCDQKEATLHVRQEIEKVVSGVVKKRDSNS